MNLQSAPNGGTAKIALQNCNATLQAIKAAASGAPAIEGQGTLYGLWALNSSAATAFIQVFDVPAAASVALGTTLPPIQIEVGAGLMVALPMPPMGVSFQNGIWVASTTTLNGVTGSANGVSVYGFYA